MISATTIGNRQLVYQITGFDRLNFVDDVANAVPQDDQCRITGLSFVVNGVRVDGQLTVWVQDDNRLASIYRQLSAIQGLVSIQQAD
ncbi:hypothetical protein [Spirosoma panaciterrae]|uniref:hypothetical protein n=1 Tax=Spirosoma panaciterrae TaxID=496058 RepID=UPI00036E4B2C|nr:hypothetical protein [Spirosoma panaciterrae]